MNQKYQQLIYRSFRMNRKIFIRGNLVDLVYMAQNPFSGEREYMYDSDIMAIIEGQLADVDINTVEIYQLVDLHSEVNL